MDNAAVGHYFDARPLAAPQPRTLSLHLSDLDLELTSDSGVFAATRVDPGTLFLLRRAPPPPRSGEILDLGCGYGAIALTIASRAPAARVWAVDINERARALTVANAAAAGLSNVTVVAEKDVPAAMRFDAIYSNPPVRVGLAVLHPLLLRWLGRLAPSGAAHLVVHRHLGSDSLARWLGSEGHASERVASHAGYRILAVQPRQAVGDDR